MKNTHTVKVVQIGETTRKNGRPILTDGEARIYANRFERTTRGGSLEDRVIPNQPIPATLDGVVLEDKADALVFVPSRQNLQSEYDEDVFLANLEVALDKLAGKDVHVVFNTPGAYGFPEVEERERREQLVHEMAELRSITSEKRFAPADMPRGRGVDVSGDVQVRFDQDTLLFVGYRKVEQNTRTRQEQLRQVAKMVLDEAGKSRVVTPAAVGLSLALAEEAVARGIPVQLVCFADFDEVWADSALKRLHALLESDLVTVTGKAEYGGGRMNSTVRFLDQNAREAGALRVVADNPQRGSEVREVRNPDLNVWEDLAELMYASAGARPTIAPEPEFDAPFDVADMPAPDGAQVAPLQDPAAGELVLPF